METYTLMKTCSGCKETKTYDEFYGFVRGKDGKQAACKSCQNATEVRFRKTTRGRSVKLISSARKRAKNKGLPFDLTREWIIDKLEAGHCELTGLPFDFESHATHFHNPRAPSLDRIDSYKGYLKDNVMLVCDQANKAKGVASAHAFKELCEGYLQHTCGYTLTDSKQLTKGTIDD